MFYQLIYVWKISLVFLSKMSSVNSEAFVFLIMMGSDKMHQHH